MTQDNGVSRTSLSREIVDVNLVSQALIEPSQSALYVRRTIMHAARTAASIRQVVNPDAHA
jgi:hypothetical protein